LIVGLGFNAGENAVWTFYGNENGLFGGPVSHSLFTCFSAAALAWASNRPRRWGLAVVLTGLLISALAHALRNYLTVEDCDDARWREVVVVFGMEARLVLIVVLSVSLSTFGWGLASIPSSASPEERKTIGDERPPTEGIETK